MTPYDNVLGRLDVKHRNGTTASARCPAHPDTDPSLSITEGDDGKVVLHCHAGCTVDDITAAVGITVKDLFPAKSKANGKRQMVAEYDYVDEHGELLFQKVRYEPKSFGQRRPDGKGGWVWKLGDTRIVLYRLPEVLAAVANDMTVFVVEGEKDADALARVGVVATCNPGGAGKFAKVMPGARRALRGAKVAIVADRDEPGYAHARDVAYKLKDHAAAITVVEAAIGKDAADHLGAGRSIDDFEVIASTDDSYLGGETVPLSEWIREPRSDPGDPGPDPDSAQSDRRVRLTAASSIQPRPVRWLWRDRIPTGEVTLTPGRGGLGKSTFHAWLIAQITRGSLDGAHHGKPRAVIIAATEDSWERTIVPRLIVAGADLGLVYRVDVVTETGNTVTISLPVDLDALEAVITAHDVALLSVDPLLGVVHGGLDTHKDSDVRQALQPLARLADRTSCCVLGNAHFNKSSGNDPLSLVMGSAAFVNVVRAAIGFARDTDSDDGSCVISQIKNNLGRLDLPSLRYQIEEATIETAEGMASVGRFVMLGESDRSVSDILGDSGNPEDREERNAAVAFVRHFLIDQGGSAPAADVIKAGKSAGFNDNIIKKARPKAAARTHRDGFGGPWLWSIDTSIGAVGARFQEPGTYGTYEAPMTPGPCAASAVPTVEEVF